MKTDIQDAISVMVKSAFSMGMRGLHVHWPMETITSNVLTFHYKRHNPKDPKSPVLTDFLSAPYIVYLPILWREVLVPMHVVHKASSGSELVASLEETLQRHIDDVRALVTKINKVIKEYCDEQGIEQKTDVHQPGEI